MKKGSNAISVTRKAGFLAALLSVSCTTNVFATGGGTGFAEYSGGLTGDGVIKGFASFFATIGTYGGALYLIGSVFSLILAIRNEDTEGRNKAILNMLAAIALISIGGVLTFFGITTT